MSTAKLYFGMFGTCKLSVVDASSDLKLFILLIIVCINYTMTMYFYNRIILQRIILRIIHSYYFETKCFLRPTDYMFQQLIMNMEVLCFHNICIDIIKHYYGLCDHQIHFIK